MQTTEVMSQLNEIRHDIKALTEMIKKLEVKHEIPCKIYKTFAEEMKDLHITPTQKLIKEMEALMREDTVKGIRSHKFSYQYLNGGSYLCDDYKNFKRTIEEIRVYFDHEGLQVRTSVTESDEGCGMVESSMTLSF